MNGQGFGFLVLVAVSAGIISQSAYAHGRHHGRGVRELPPPVEMTIPEQSYYCVEVHCQGPPPVLPYPGLQIRPVPLPAAPVAVAPPAPVTFAPPAPSVTVVRPMPAAAPVAAGGLCLIVQSQTGNGFYDLVLDQSKLLYQGYGPNVEAMLDYYRSTGVCRR